MKQLFQACLNWGDAGTEGGHHDLSNYTDEEHLSGNRKRLSKMSGQYAALTNVQPQTTHNQNLQLNCNPPSTAVASTSATYSYEASSNIVRLSVEEEDYIDTLAHITDEQCNFEADAGNGLLDDPIAAAAAKVASKISLAISTPVETAKTAPVVPDDDPDLFGPVDVNARTLQLPVIDCEPPKSENRSGLSGSFRRQSGAHKMTHWTSKKAAGADAWDSRVDAGVKEYEKNSKYGLSYWDAARLEGSSFIELDTPADAPGYAGFDPTASGVYSTLESDPQLIQDYASTQHGSQSIDSFGAGEPKAISSFENQGAGIRRLSSMRSQMRMIEMHDDAELHKPLDPSNSYDKFNSFVSYKSTDSTPRPKSSASEEAALMADAVEERNAELAAVATDAESSTAALLEDSFEELMSDCYGAAKEYEDLSARFENSIEMDKPVISFAPDALDSSIVEGWAGNFSVTFAESLAVCEKEDVAGHIHEQICFDPKAFAPHTIHGEPIEAVCVFDSTEKLSFKASETIRTNLESMFNINPLSQIEELTGELSDAQQKAEDKFEIESVTVVSIEDCELLEIAAVGGKPSRQKAKGTSRSKKTQTRREKRTKKRTTAANA